MSDAQLTVKDGVVLEDSRTIKGRVTMPYRDALSSTAAARATGSKRILKAHPVTDLLARVRRLVPH